MTKRKIDTLDFLPTTQQELRKLGWDRADIILITGDAYVDHPSFGVALIARWLEKLGYRVAILAQPDWRCVEPFRFLGKPRLFWGITSGCIALMIEAALRLRYPNRDRLSFARLGKPHAAIFKEALRRSGTRNMVMVGDQLETDIRGANAFGIDSVLIDTGITRMNTVDSTDQNRPTYRLAELYPG